MSDISLIQDLAQKNLRIVPKELLNFKNLRMLYLEGNQLTEIPKNLFTALNKLQWLDIRNNKITKIPVTVMHHSYLETFLLQNNYLNTLPLELGFVPNLKVLQLGGNPITYPAKEVIELGLDSIMKFLRSEYVKREHKKKSTDSESTSESTESSELVISSDKISSESTSLEIEEKPTPKMPILTLKSFHRLPKKRKARKTKKIPHRSRSKYIYYKDSPFNNSNRCWNSYPQKPNEYRIKEQSLKDLFLRKMQEVLLRQEETIQRQKNTEAMKNWRHAPKYRNKSQDLDYRPEVPYDYDSNYDKMPSRCQLTTMESTSQAVTSYKPKKYNMEKLINDVVDSLKLLEKDRHVNRSPRSQMNFAGREIKKILELQKRLSALKISNFNM